MSNLAIYAYGGDFTPIYGSGFTTCIINSFHWHTTGISWNDTLVVDASGTATSDMAALASAVQGLQQNGLQVILSIGGGGSFGPNASLNAQHSVSDVDFMSFNALYFGDGTMTGWMTGNAALAMLSTLVTATGANGIDLDPEPMFFSYAQFASATVFLTEWAQAQGIAATWAPYMAQSSWQAYAGLLTADGAAPPSWINVQPPAWGGDASALQAWASLGAPLVPGFDGGSPADIQNTLAGLVNGGYTPAGAYYWNFTSMGSSTPTELATAMSNGLQGITTS